MPNTRRKKTVVKGGSGVGLIAYIAMLSKAQHSTVGNIASLLLATPLQ
jgi:predicted nicotinamide N-methyase